MLLTLYYIKSLPFSQKAGTWEEKNTTDWCTTKLTTLLNSLSFVTDVKDLAGDASVVMIRGKKRYLFDLNCKVEFEVTNNEDEVIGKGVITLTDISSTAGEDGCWDQELSLKKGRNNPTVLEGNEKRKREVNEMVNMFVKSFNAEY